MKISGAVALVTGSNQGIGRGFVQALLQLGARRIYATARQLESLPEVVALAPERVVPLRPDITSCDDRKRAAHDAPDVTLLINNAGIPGGGGPLERRFLSATSLDDLRSVMETNFFAQAEMCRSFAPALRRAEDAAIVNVLSIGALYCVPEFATYSASKAATAIMTQGVRAELAPDGVEVFGVFTAGVQTRMSVPRNRPRMSPLEHGHEVLRAIENGIEDIYVGTGVNEIVSALYRDRKGFEQNRIARFLNSQDLGQVQ